MLFSRHTDARGRRTPCTAAGEDVDATDPGVGEPAAVARELPRRQFACTHQEPAAHAVRLPEQHGLPPLDSPSASPQSRRPRRPRTQRRRGRGEPEETRPRHARWRRASEDGEEEAPAPSLLLKRSVARQRPTTRTCRRRPYCEGGAAATAMAPLRAARGKGWGPDAGEEKVAREHAGGEILSAAGPP